MLRGICALLVVTILLSPAGTIAQATRDWPTHPHATTSSDIDLTSVKPDQQEYVAASVDASIARYTISVLLHEDPDPTLTGALSVRYTNVTGDELAEIPFRLYANNADEPDIMTVEGVTVDGNTVETALQTDNSTLVIALAKPLAADDSVTIAMSFEVRIPIDTSSNYGILGVNSESGTWALAEWYPMLAGWEAENGWELDPVSQFGDPIFSTTSTYDVTITAPTGWAVVTTGITVDATRDDDTETRTIRSGPVRDFTIVADADYESVSREVDGTTVTSWYNPDDREVGAAVLDYAAQSLALYNELIGDYLYTELDVVPVELYGAAGVEFPQLIYIGQTYYGSGTDLSVPNYLDFTVAHEVMHQWWYAAVGNNQYEHAFIDEGLTNFVSSRIYFTEIYDADAAAAIYNGSILNPYTQTIERDEDVIVDTPTDDFPTENDYVWAAYSKAPIGFNAIYEAIGEEAFFTALTAYYDEFAFEVATPDDLLAAFEEASGQDLDDLWAHWFEEAAKDTDV